ncbi:MULTISPECIES: GNAT family N-acetyltransferase [Rahnella]|jgi:ribosomal protein S18 acetylase RimI-like enzyme|uniref:GNAT family N-acetyltransferase n=1 Tax=Rahnella TaxID=34037 RepID=UPI000E646EC0|nr:MULTISPECIES: GNAT family N-acetyltransferase [Rahnella]AYA07421.1 GNAT family N-acetyltransferase [Rahnella aquatilis]AZP51386.1 GNAT family N-acetyltransferase [Rahnella aquatilis]MCM2444915.1 GNAT family N-acetyltransferase [Rahnella sp. CG8]QBJ07886.1 GNAT family N-acetyltransferase [Rahnella aquatilis]UNK54087.1 GNAT family N-acetyltransferase [Rahnella aceris]
MEIREADIGDLSLLQRLGRETYRHYFGSLWQSGDELNAFLEEGFGDEALALSLESPDCCWLVAQDNGEAVGFARLNFNTPLDVAEGQGAKLCKLYFTPLNRSRGLGSEVFAFAERVARARNQPVLWLDVLQSNLPAIGFYQRQGMHLAAETTYVTATQTTRLWIMKKDIND